MMEAREAVISFSATMEEVEVEEEVLFVLLLLLIVLCLTMEDVWSSLLMAVEPKTLRTTLRGRLSAKLDDDNDVE